MGGLLGKMKTPDDFSDFIGNDTAVFKVEIEYCGSWGYKPTFEYF